MAVTSLTPRISLVVALLLAGVAPSLYAQARFGVVDLNRAVVETNEGRRANGHIKGWFKRRQDELDLRRSSLKLMLDDIQRRRGEMDERTLQARMEEYQRQLVTYSQTALEYQDELAQREAKVTKHIFTNLQALMQQVGARQNFTAILEKQGVVYHAPSLDLTEQIVRAYNEQYPPSRWPPLPADEIPDGGPTATAADAGR
jgi:outer membrane protein